MTAPASSSVREMVALNADVVGYSRLLADDFQATTAAMDLYQSLVAEAVVAASGTLVNFVGDNFMAAFDEATEAMQAAIAVTEAVADKNAGLPTQRQVRFRMGMDHGEVMVSGEGQYFGDALNIAARIQAIALPGGVSVSGSVYRALDEPALRFRSMGPKSLKNIPEQVQVYQFSDLPTDDPQAGRGRLLALESPSVAVLPIHTESLDPSLRPAGALLISDVIHHLAGMPNLNVIDASDEQHPNRADTPVEYMLETGIQQFDDQIRVYAKLVDVATINVVFSHRWEATPATLSALSDDVATEVAHLLEIELVVGEPARIYAEIGDPEAQEHIYRGWYQLNSGTREGWERAIEHFDKVAETHPDLPAGHALLAFAHWTGAAERFGSDPKSHLAKARAHAQKGLATGDPTGLSQMVEAAILMSEGKAELALERAESAHITRPTCDVTYALEGSVRRYMGQWEKAVDLLGRAMQMTPVTKPWYPTVQACSLYMGGRYEDAASIAETVLAHQPKNLEALLVLAAAQTELGLDRRARATSELIRDRFPSVEVDEWLERNPYQDPALVEQWKTDLQAAGVLTS